MHRWRSALRGVQVREPAALITHRQEQDAERTMAGDGPEDAGLVFTTALGGCIHPSNFGRPMNVLIAKAFPAR